jgi:hypothetical protein
MGTEGNSFGGDEVKNILHHDFVFILELYYKMSS